MSFAGMTVSALLTISPAPAAGASDTADFISKKVGEVWRDLRSSLTLGQENEAIESLNDVAQTCSRANWDGYSAEPILARTVRNARCFVEALPLGIPAPSAGAEPDGHVTMEWYRSPRRTLSVSITPDGELHYAALLGSSKAYGSEPFFGEIPKRILELIARISA